MAPGGKQLPNGEPAPGGDSLVVAPEAAKAGRQGRRPHARLVPELPLPVGELEQLAQRGRHPGQGGRRLRRQQHQRLRAVERAGLDLEHRRRRRLRRRLGPHLQGGPRRRTRAPPIQGPSYSALERELDDHVPHRRQGQRHACRTSSAGTSSSGPASIAADVAAYRSLETSLGIGPLPIAIEEYGETSEVGVPGPLAGYIAKFERAGVNNAELAFWNHYGTLGDTLTDTGGSPERRLLALPLVRLDDREHGHHRARRRRPASTAPPRSTRRATRSASSSAAAAARRAVTVNGLSSLSAFGSTAHVVLEQTASAGRTTAVVGPTIISSRQRHHLRRLHHRPGQLDERRQRLPPADHARQQRRRSPARYKIKNVNSGLVLDTSGSGTAQGTAGRPGHRERAAPPRTGPWSRRAPTSTRSRTRPAACCSASPTRASRPARDALIWGNNGTSDHLWQLVSAGSGEYKIVNYNSGLVLGVHEREHLLRRPGPAMDRQRHRRPPLDPDRGLIRAAAVQPGRPSRERSSA